jgi:CelD/BcsL family acetyltransferase involved in cellulose biosynthesis
VLEVITEDGFPSGERAAAWDALVEADPAASVFHSPRFLLVWAQHMGQRSRPRLRYLYDDGALVAVVPEVREVEGSATGPREIVSFAGGHGVTDYLGPVSAPGIERAAVVDAWLARLAEEADWDDVVAEGLPEDAGWHTLIADGAIAAGWGVHDLEVEDVCPRIDLTGGWDAYLARLPGKERHELRRKARKLAREGGEVTVHHVAASELDDALALFIELHRAAEGPKGRFFRDERAQAFFAALMRELGDDELRVHRLDAAGVPVAMAVSFVHAGEWGLYNSAFDQERRALAPGMVLVAELIRSAAEEGCDVFDLLRGAEGYKYRFGAIDRPVWRLVITRT